MAEGFQIPPVCQYPSGVEDVRDQWISGPTMLLATVIMNMVSSFDPSLPPTRCRHGAARECSTLPMHAPRRPCMLHAAYACSTPPMHAPRRLCMLIRSISPPRRVHAWVSPASTIRQ